MIMMNHDKVVKKMIYLKKDTARKLDEALYKLRVADLQIPMSGFVEDAIIYYVRLVDSFIKQHESDKVNRQID